MKLLIMGLIFSALVGYSRAENSESQSGSSQYDVTLDSMNVEERLIVVNDRQFFVPPGTPIFNASGRAISLSRLVTQKKLRISLVDNQYQSSGQKIVRIDMQE